jgi:hypothetical protein
MAPRGYRHGHVTEPSSPPEFGPRGYLPERASKRARKIVLRAPLGLQWIVAAAVFGVLVLVAGLLWLTSGGPPGPPFVPAAAVDGTAGPAVTHVDDPDLWLVTGAGPVLAVPSDTVDALVWCEASNRLEAEDGRVWTATGRGLGTDSLPTHPVTVHDGTAYVDPGTTVPGARPAEEAAPPAC